MGRVTVSILAACSALAALMMWPQYRTILESTTLGKPVHLSIHGGVSVAPDNPALSYIGRFDRSDPSKPSFQWPMTTISTQFQCKEAAQLQVQFEVSDWYTSLAAYIGGKQVAQEFFTKGTRSLNVLLPAGTSLLTIETDVEQMSADPAMYPHTPGMKPEYEPVYFLGMTVSGSCTLTKPRAKARRIEVIGDSISCGYGIHNKPNSCKYQKGWTSCAKELSQNMKPFARNRSKLTYTVTSAHRSYASQIARRFDAELHLQCISGIGMCKNYNDISSSDARNMSFWVDRTLPFNQKGAPGEWDYTRWHPDLLLINLGTNDYDTSVGAMAQLGYRAPSESAFHDQYLKFVMHFLKHYNASKTKVLLCCGPMTNSQCSTVNRVADDLKKSFGIAVAYADVSLSGSPNSLNGVGDHPSEAEHTEMVELIHPVLADLTGWTVGSPTVENILA